MRWGRGEGGGAATPTERGPDAGPHPKTRDHALSPPGAPVGLFWCSLASLILPFEEGGFPRSEKQARGLTSLCFPVGLLWPPQLGVPWPEKPWSLGAGVRGQGQTRCGDPGWGALGPPAHTLLGAGLGLLVRPSAQ